MIKNNYNNQSKLLNFNFISFNLLAFQSDNGSPKLISAHLIAICFVFTLGFNLLFIATIQAADAEKNTTEQINVIEPNSVNKQPAPPKGTNSSTLADNALNNGSLNEDKSPIDNNLTATESTDAAEIAENTESTESADNNYTAPTNTSETASLNSINKNKANSVWLFMNPYDAQYTIISEGESLGYATRRLVNQPQKSSSNIEITEHNQTTQPKQWKLEMYTKLSKWFLTLKSNEHSVFTTSNEQLKVQEFVTTTKISFKKEKQIKQQFDWLSRIESGNKDKLTWQLPFEENVFDRMSHLIKLRADLLQDKEHFSYLVSYKGRHREYTYAKAGYETIQSEAMGEVIALRMDRESGDDGSFSIWLSPELNYFPVKIAQFEQDKPDVELILNKLEYLSIAKHSTR